MTPAERKLTPEQRATLRVMKLNAIDKNRQKRTGKIDHILAARAYEAELLKSEVGGERWIGGVLDDARFEGLLAAIKNQARLAIVHIKHGDGSVDRMPTSYSRPNANGGLQLCFWMDMSLEEIDGLITELVSQASVLSGRGKVLMFARELMVKHGAKTPRAAFLAEGLDPDSIDMPDEAAS